MRWRAEGSETQGSASKGRGAVTVGLGLTSMVVGAAWFSWYHRMEAPGTVGFDSFIGIALAFVGGGGVLGGLAVRGGWGGCWYALPLAAAILVVLFYIADVVMVW
jgi:hypothetical protein